MHQKHKVNKLALALLNEYDDGDGDDLTAL